MCTFTLVEENTGIEKPKRTVLKKIGRFSLFLFSALLLLMGALLALLFFYEDEVKAAVVTELNKHLKAEVKIDPKNIDLTIIKTFPDCSIEFKDLLMLEALPIKKRDTLLFAGRLNLHFNIKNLWNKNYRIEKIKLKDALVKLRVLKNGKTNYVFWDDSPDTDLKKNDSLNFDLKLITIENCRLSYKDKKALFKTELEIKKLSFKGHFKESNFDLGSNASVFIKELTQGKTTYLKDKSCDFSLELSVNNNSYELTKAELKLNQLALNLSGNFRYKDSLERINIRYEAPDLDISSILSLLPEKFKGEINAYESTGNFYANGKVQYENRNKYLVIGDFGIKNGKITYKPQSTSLTGVNVDGRLELTGKTSYLDLKNIFAQLNSDQIKGSCKIFDLSKPYLQLEAQANLKLEQLQSFWPIDTLTALKGSLIVNTKVEGSLKDLKEQTFSTKVLIDLEASVSALEAQFKGDEKVYTVESCQITAREREIEVKDLKLKRGSSDITLNGKIPGVFNYIMDRNSPLTITGSLYSNLLNMEDFLSNGSQSSGSNDKPLIPANIDFKLNAAILQFHFGKFEARAITGEMEIKNQKAIITDMKLQTLQGEAEIDAFADNSGKNLEVVLQSKLNNINVTDLFSQLNNFGQTTLTDKNIKGVASATIDFSGSWTNQLVANANSIVSSCDLNIQRGELIDFKPLLSLSKFVDVQDLKRIKFASLQSNIEIKNSVITLPRTSIKNSALNIEVWGTHTFNNVIDYHIQLLISELLAKKRKNRDTEFGPIENDKENKRSAFLLMTGTIDDPVIKYDRKGLKEKIKGDIKQEKQTIKQLLKEEFGLFRKDSAVKKQKREEQVFELETPDHTPPKKTLELKKKKEDEDDF